MAKKSTYQKLKDRVASLESDIRELVLRPDSFESQMIKSDIIFIDQMEKSVFFGSGNKTGKAKGLMNWANEHGTVVITSTAIDPLREPHTKATPFNALNLESRGADSVGLHDVKLPKVELKLLSDLSDVNRPVLGEFYADGTVILECVELDSCQQCYLDNVRMNAGYHHSQCHKAGCGTLSIGVKPDSILGFIRKCSAHIED